jgi:uncharacterized protein
MSIHTDIKNEIKKAMLAKDAVRLTVVRGLVASFTNELIMKNSPHPELPDEDALALIRRAVKQRKDSIEQFRKGGREDLVKTEEAELIILESYLPKMMGRDEISHIAEVAAKRMGVGPGGKANLGHFIGMLMKELKGKADGADVKAVAEELLK